MISYKQVLKPTILFAAGSFASVAHAQVTHLDLDYSATDEGTLVALGVAPASAQYTFTSSMMQFETLKPITSINGLDGSLITWEGSDAGVIPGRMTPSMFNGTVKTVGPSGPADGYYGIQFKIGDELELGYLTVDQDGTHISAADYTAAPPAAVPEPAIWAELILGFGVAGAALRRRQSASPATA